MVAFQEDGGATARANASDGAKGTRVGEDKPRATLMEVVEATISSGKAGLPAAVPTRAAVAVGVAISVAVEIRDAMRVPVVGRCSETTVVFTAGLYPETYWKPHGNERPIHPNDPRPRCYLCD